MYTTLFLVRNADTDISRDGRVAGRRDIGLSRAGRAQAEALRDHILASKHEIVEILA
jgi:broad specificity phosphatase PhoE